MSIFGQLKRLTQSIAEARKLGKMGIDAERGFGHEPKGGYRRDSWIADAAQLDALIERTGYRAFAEDIHQRSQPCLHIFATGRAADAPLGATRFGGLPDLPLNADWPRDADARPTSFYAQIDMRDVAGTVVADRLPQSGLLSFFGGDLQAWPGPIPVSAILIPEGTALTRLAAPADAMQDEAWSASIPVSVRFEAGLSFPSFDFDWLEQFEPAGSKENFDAFETALWPPFPVLGQLLGYAAWTQDDLREEIHFGDIGRSGQQRLRYWQSWEAWERAKTIENQLAGGSTYRPWSASDDANVRWMLDHSTEIDRAVEGWQSLLTIESNHAMDLWINDANAIYFFARGDALAACDFSSTRAVTTQS